MTDLVASPTPADPATLSHVADFARRYPGERVTFFTRIDPVEARVGHTLWITLPEGIELAHYSSPEPLGHPVPWIEREEGVTYLVWHLPEAPPARYEYEVTGTVGPAQADRTLESSATLVVGTEEERSLPIETGSEIRVSARGRYLGYLPGIYQNDDFMGRFLMLFESFWGPIDRQIDSLPFYFDPRMMPADLLPWLAGWFNLALDEHWPEARRRELLRSAVELYRKRGTREGLQAYVELFTGQPIRIVEHHNENLALGSTARLGRVALGRGNVPHTFTVIVPLSEERRAAEPHEQRHQRRMIETIIQNEKPAHTRFTLLFEEQG